MFCEGDYQASAGRDVNAEIVSMSALAIEYDQYEFTIPFGKAYVCMSRFLNGLLATSKSRTSFLGPVVVSSFMGKECSYLSLAHHRRSCSSTLT